MSYSISTLLTRNLHDVFGENDPERRRAAIDDHVQATARDQRRGTARGARVAARIAAHPARTPDARAEPGGYPACFSYVSPRRLGAAAEGRACHEDGSGRGPPLPSSRTPQCFGVIFPAKVWVTIFPSFTTKVSVPIS
jgi:hypothetical protein